MGALVLRLRRQVVLPTIWLSKEEWRLCFLRDLPRLVTLLDGSQKTVLEDIGGFENMVEGALWTDKLTKICLGCHRELPIEEFRMQDQSHDRTLLVLRPRCPNCEAERVLKSVHAKQAVGANN